MRDGSPHLDQNFEYSDTVAQGAHRGYGGFRMATCWKIASSVEPRVQRQNGSSNDHGGTTVARITGSGCILKQ